MEDGTNPVYDKEIRSEIFGSGTLMLRLVIQVSMLLAIPLMAIFLYVYRSMAPWYISYVVLFNILVGPVFSAGSVTSERERQTLDLLLTTVITPWQLLWGKLLSGLRVSSVLTSFLLWPVVLATIMIMDFWSSLPSMIAYLLIIALTCISSAILALFCSTLFYKTSISLMTTYMVILVLYMMPLAGNYFAQEYLPNSTFRRVASAATVASPFAAAFNVPLYTSDELDRAGDSIRRRYAKWDRAEISGTSQIMGYPLRDLQHLGGYVLFTVLFNALLFGLMIWRFNSRWRVSTSMS
jgi:ABC-type transport system involved in multi-copper enzyme maturation permease subunit